MRGDFEIPDGLEEIKHAIPDAVRLIVHTARWVHPDTFHALPVWYPEIARGRPIFDASWNRQYTNKNKKTKFVQNKVEANVLAAKAFVSALGVSKVSHWTVCHIWGYDDPKFAKSGAVVRDPRFYSCLGNMVWLPTPLKGFTDAAPEIKSMLRVCAYYLYGWACEHEDVFEEAEKIRAGFIPDGYPDEWPVAFNIKAPPGTAPYSERVRFAVRKRKAELRRLLETPGLKNFPYSEVKKILEDWNVSLDPPLP